MRLIEILEKDRESLLTEIAGAGSAEKAGRVLENETDKLLLRFNEQCDSEKERDAAAYMLQAIRLSLPLVDSVGKTKVWESGVDRQKGRITFLGIILLIAGLLLCGFGLAPLLMLALNYTDAAGRTDILMRGGAVAAGLILMFASGSRFTSPVPAKKEQHVEISVDPEKIYRNYRNAILSVDQSLEEVRSAERWSQREKAGEIDGHKASTSELELFSDLLAASYSGDPEYALEKIEAVKYFLHRQQIDAVDYSEETAKYFDLMPGIQTGTIRPALVSDGALLRKGLASSGKQ